MQIEAGPAMCRLFFNFFAHVGVHLFCAVMEENNKKFHDTLNLIFYFITAR